MPAEVAVAGLQALLRMLVGKVAVVMVSLVLLLVVLWLRQVILQLAVVAVAVLVTLPVQLVVAALSLSGS